MSMNSRTKMMMDIIGEAKKVSIFPKISFVDVTALVINKGNVKWTNSLAKKTSRAILYINGSLIATRKKRSLINLQKYWLPLKHGHTSESGCLSGTEVATSSALTSKRLTPKNISKR